MTPAPAHPNMPIAEIEQAHALHIWIKQRLSGLSMPGDRNADLSISAFDAVVKHHLGITLLLKCGVYGSAFALLRSVFETYVRGCWLRYCATEADLDRFRKDQLDIKFGALVAAVEAVPGFEAGVLSGLKKSSWNAMNSLTHGGMQQLGRRMRDNVIEPDYSSDEVMHVARLSISFAHLSFQKVTRAAGRDDLALESFEMLELRAAGWPTV